MPVDNRHRTPTSDQINEELSRVLASAEFLASRHLERFLRFVVDEALAGRADRLKERNIAIGALNRNTDFDPRLDCIVRVVAGKLRRALDRYYARDGANNPIRLEIPKGGYRPVFALTATPASDDFRIPDYPSVSSPAATNDNAVRPRIVVMPFDEVTRSGQELRLANALAQDLRAMLKQFHWFEVLDVPAAQSRGSEKYVPVGAPSKLDADFCLAGTLARRGDSIRVTAELTNSDCGTLIWVGQFDIRAGFTGQRGHDEFVQQVMAHLGDMFGALATAEWRRSQQDSADQLMACDTVLRTKRLPFHPNSATHVMAAVH
jgi:TolB-like protein